MNENTTRIQMLCADLSRIYNYRKEDLPQNKLGLRLSILRYFIVDNSFRSIYFYRLANSGIFKNINELKFLLLIIRRILQCLDIPFTAKIEEGLFMGHPKGVVLHPLCIIGKNVTILQEVTIGGNIGKMKDGREAPTIGNNVLIGAGAKVLGPISIGDNSMIGANAVVIKDVPSNSVAVGVPAKVVKKVRKSFIEIEKMEKERICNQ